MISDKNSTIRDIFIGLSIAGKSLGIHTNDEVLAEKIKKWYLIYLTNDNPQINIRIFWRVCSFEPSLYLSRPILESGNIAIRSEGVEGFYDFNNRNGELSISAENPYNVIEYFLRLIYAITIFTSGGLLLHSAGIIRNERAFIFFGHSGSGKTTISQISKNEVVLSDDLVILLPDVGNWIAHSTPFWNPVGIQFVKRFAQIIGLYHLIQDRKVFSVRLTRSNALAELLSNIPIIPLFPTMADQLFERGVNVINSIPTYALHFLPDESFWDVIDD